MKHTVFFVVAVLIAGMSFAQTSSLCKEDYGEVQKSYVESIQLINMKKYKEAIPHLKCCLEYNQQWGEGWKIMGDCYAALKDYKNAMTAYENARKVGYKGMDLVHNMIAIYLNTGEKTKARELLKGVKVESIESAQAKKEFYELRGKFYFDEKDYQNAVRDYEQALALERGAQNAYIAGICHQLLGDIDKAIPHLRTAVSLDAKNMDAKSRLTNMLIDKANRDNQPALYGEAEKLMEDVTKAQPNDARNWRLLGEAQIGAKKFDAAIASLKKSLAIEPNNCYAKHNMGRSYNFKSSWDLAIQTLTDAVKCNPRDHRMYNDLGWAAENKWKGQRDNLALLDQAKSFYEKANSLKPGSASSHIERVASLRTNVEIDMEEKKAQEDKARLDAERQRILAQVKLSEPSRKTATVGGQILTMIFATVNNQSDKTINAVVEASFFNSGGTVIKTAKQTTKGVTPKASKPVALEVEGVENAADYRLRVADVEFEFR